MRKNVLFVTVFIMLLFAVAIAAPKPDNAGMGNESEDKGMQGNGSANATVITNKERVRANIPINVSNLPVAAQIRTQIHQVFLTGRGIAVNPENELDFRYIRIITGRVLVSPNNISEESSNSADLEVTCINTTAKERCYPLVRAGVLYLDEERYNLRNIDVDNESATASIYKNDTEVGSIALVKVDKMDAEIWAGKLTVSGTTYYAYILGLQHQLRVTAEVQERVQEYKACGPKLPSVNATEISSCKKEGGRIYIGRDENGCPMAPTCVKTSCPPVTPVSAQLRVRCRNQGGTLVGGVDDDGCPVSQKCLLASGETAG
ncbi:MAG: hypothetical protein Sv326_0310 [Candidatus Fermentimicrarchaeum limneticum]|uniref:Uncharacterized protein n=1 Tax=Fermentimicrarchaeum limneticum TaxID=2795018 RepID=A0A7D5XBM2_FERL1|nr:MAG: hypothetical protein Sv326_0310 [Candidatus Fermentimicrarchaeum limneticum]